MIWCRHDGLLLVDGLRIEPRRQVGVLSGTRGVVVNLTGDHAPRQLSTDRLTVLEDVSAQVEELLTAAAPTLVTSGAAFLTLAWVQELAKSSPRTADLVAQAAFEAGVGFGDRRRPTVPAAAGCFPLDRALLDHLLTSNRRSARSTDAGFYSIPDHILLWRMLAHEPTDLVRQLAELVPELVEPRQVVRARPSDLELLTGGVAASGSAGRRTSSASPGGSAAVRPARWSGDASSGSATSCCPAPQARVSGTSRT